ncbi:uncharacterized protein [Periplaneta americana]|uniref:uncharacterized protein n=1 Tax=Periplaneta americana TaxID=6978 RepID=UPI0037E7D2DD
MAEEAESEIVTVIFDHLNKVQQALKPRNNTDKTLKEEAIISVSEINNLLNRLSGMFLGLENTLKKALTTVEATPRFYSEQLAASTSATANYQTPAHPLLLPSGGQPNTASLIVKPTDPTMNPDNMKQLIRETVDPKALKVGVNKMKKLSNNTLFVECNNSTDRDTLEKELTIRNALSIERPKKKLPAILLKFVPRYIDDAEVKDVILQQNNLTHLENPVIDIKFTKAKFEDSRHLVVQVSPNIRRELLALQRIKLKWSMCRVEDFTIITRCLKCLGYGHTSKYCNNKQTCSYCAEEHSWKDCRNEHNLCCFNCLKANTFITNNDRKLDTRHTALSKDCPRLKRIESIIISKTEY